MNIRTFCFLLLALFSLSGATEELVNLSVEQVHTMQQNNNALVIDIRTEKEWQTTGIIPASHKLEFFNSEGKYDAEKWLAELEKLKSSPDQPVILVCRSGNRSGMVGNFLAKQLGMKNIYHLSSGIQSWSRTGLKLENECLPNVACK